MSSYYYYYYYYHQLIDCSLPLRLICSARLSNLTREGERESRAVSQVYQVHMSLNDANSPVISSDETDPTVRREGEEETVDTRTIVSRAHSPCACAFFCHRRSHHPESNALETRLKIVASRAYAVALKTVYLFFFRAGEVETKREGQREKQEALVPVDSID